VFLFNSSGPFDSFFHLKFLLQSCIISKFAMLGTFLNYLWPHIRKSFDRVVWGWLCCNYRLRDISNCWSNCIILNIILFVHFLFGGFFLTIFYLQSVVTQINHAIGAEGYVSFECKSILHNYGDSIWSSLIAGVCSFVILHLIIIYRLLLLKF